MIGVIKEESLWLLCFCILFTFFPIDGRSEKSAVGSPASYDEIMQSLDQISIDLRKYQEDIESNEDVGALTDIEKKVTKLYKEFPNMDEWFRANKKLDPLQVSSVRDKAYALKVEFFNVRVMLASKLGAIQQKMLAEQLQRRDQNFEKKFAAMQSSGDGSIYWYIGILFVMAMLGGLGYWGYFNLLKKIGDSDARRELAKQHEDFFQLSLRAFSYEMCKLLDALPHGKTGKDRDETVVITEPQQRVARKSPMDSLVTLYNRIVYENEIIGDFWQNYEVTTIGVTNSEEMVGNDKIPPQFGKASNGEFYAVKITDEDHRKKYAVVPKFGLIFSEAKFLRGGLKFVFDCSDFQAGRKSGTIVVIKPAFFEPEGQGESWRRVDKGEIGLEQKLA
jgi:hypothetical protein